MITLLTLAAVYLVGLLVYDAQPFNGLIVAAVVVPHVIEERALGFRGWINALVSGNGYNRYRPIGSLEAAFQGIALLVALPCLAHLGGAWLAGAIGFMAADLAQHVGIAFRPPGEASPGQITAGLLYGPVCWHFHDAAFDHPVAAGVGALALGLNLALAFARARRIAW
jgi:hypothetical protein